MDTTIRRVGFPIFYLGLMLIVMSVKVDFSAKVLPMACLLVIGFLNGFLPEKIISKDWYRALIIGGTIAMLVSPFLVLGIRDGI